MQNLETLLEEGALQPRSKGRLILEQEDGWIVPVPLVAFLRTNAFLRDFERCDFGASNRCPSGAASSIIPAPTVALEIASIRMKLPVARLLAYGSKKSGT